LSGLRSLWPPTLLLVGAGLVSAFQVGKAPAAIQTVQAAFDIPLANAAWLLSAFGIVGAVLGVAIGAVTDRVGAKRSLVGGLFLQAAAAAMGALAPSAAVLIASRIVEGLGFLAVIVAAPTLIARVVDGRPSAGPFAAWSAFMPVGMALALLVSPLLLSKGWRALWWGSSALALGYALLAAWRAPDGVVPPGVARDAAPRVRSTVLARGPLALLLLFMLYAAAWFALFGFLPVVLADGAMGAGMANLLTAAAIVSGAAGNLLGGALLARRLRPATLVSAALALSALLALAMAAGPAGPWTRYVLILAFAVVSGAVPPALFAEVPAQAPHPSTIGLTLGMMMQGNSLGLIAGPSLGAGLMGAGGWPALATGIAAAAMAGIAVAFCILPRGRRN
jgi:predicted MFS family arabinose efflux permease